MIILKKNIFFILFLGICLSFVDLKADQSIASILGNYKKTSEVELTGITSINLSGITFNPVSQTLFVIDNDEPVVMHEIDKKGALLRSIKLRGLKDPEDITYFKNDTFFVVEEGLCNLVRFPIPKPGVDSVVPLKNCTSYKIDVVMENNGLEGVTYHAGMQTVYITKEKVPSRIYRVPVDSTGNVKEVIFNEPFNIEQNAGDAAAIYACNDGTFLLLNEETKSLIGYTSDGKVLSHLVLDMFQPEGVTINPADKTIYIIGEPRYFATFKNPDVSILMHSSKKNQMKSLFCQALITSDNLLRAELSLAAPGLVSVRLVSLQGRCIQDIFKGTLTAGTHILSEKIRSIPAGISIIECRQGLQYSNQCLLNMH
ncbi:MAG: SdiA-regulated domain-containing protein [Chitinivibrionales bacterium]|nr:SdiA-regulated domain-containing protein [Chitinivibrionales bacterium]